MKLRQLLCVGIFLFLMSAVQAGLVLKDCVIYVPEKSSPSVKHAGIVLQKYLKAALGEELDIVNQPAKKMIALGDSPALRKSGINPEKLQDEEIRIRTWNGSLYIAGKDYPDDADTRYSGKSYGTLYGVYEFLDQFMGMRFLLPILDIDGIGVKSLKKRAHIPERDADFALGDIDYRYVPRITSRKKWTRYGTQMYFPNREISSVSGIAGHSWGYLYPAKNHPYAKFLKDRETTFQEHPEYFQLAENGKRINPQTRADMFSLCLSNPEVLKDVAQRVLILAEKTGKKMLSIEPNDATPNCACAECKKQMERFSEAEAGPTSSRGGFISKTPLVLNYFCTVSEIVQKKRPDLLITGGFYYNYEFPPKNGFNRKLPTNFQPSFWLLHTSYGPIRYYDPVNTNYHRWLTEWMKYFPEKSGKIYGKYDFWYRHGNGVLPPAAKYLEETRQFILKYNFDGFNHQTSYCIGSVPDTWITPRMCWYPHLSVESIYTDWLESSFGKKAAPHIRKLYDIVEAGIKKYVVDHKGFVGYNMNADMMAEAYAARWPEIEECYKLALREPKDKYQQWRLEKSFGYALRLTGYHLRCMGLAEVKKDSPLYLDREGVLKINALRASSSQELWTVLPGTSMWSTTGATYRNKAKAAADVSGKLPGSDKFQSRSWFHFEDFVILADRDGDFELQMEWETGTDQFTGKKYRTEIPYYTLYDAAGTSLQTGVLAEKGLFKFPVKKGKIYFLYYGPLYEYRSGARFRIKSANMPYAIGHLRHPSGMRVENLQNPLYFKIKEGTKEFELLFHRGAFNVDLIGPDGKVAKHVEGKDYVPVRITSPQAGWWRIQPGKHCAGFIRQGKGMTGFFVYDPNHAADIERTK